MHILPQCQAELCLFIRLMVELSPTASISTVGTGLAMEMESSTAVAIEPRLSFIFAALMIARLSE